MFLTTAWLPDELLRRFIAAKAAATQPSGAACFAWIVGPNILPYRLEANRIGIDMCLRHAAEQGLMRRVYDAAEVFVG